ncbi:MAG: hypothetical protein ACYDB3_09600 [Acidimicrobiales bacterium]
MATSLPPTGHWTTLDDFARRSGTTARNVRALQSSGLLFEMTWSFSGPDGRATWQWTTVVDAGGGPGPAVRWRRLGNHGIFRSP